MFLYYLFGRFKDYWIGDEVILDVVLWVNKAPFCLESMGHTFEKLKCLKMSGGFNKKATGNDIKFYIYETKQSKNSWLK
jgi:hypothetical protein